MRSAPPISSRRTRSRTSDGRRDDAEPEVVRQPDVVGEADDVAAAPRRRDERAGALHPRPLDARRVAIASRSATSTKARNVPTSRVLVKPAWTVTRALRTDRNASWAPAVVVPGTPAVWTSPTRWLWVSMSPGRTVRPAEVDHLGVVRHAVVGPGDRLDPRVAHEERPRPDELAGLDVQQARRRGWRAGGSASANGAGLGIAES